MLQQISGAVGIHIRVGLCVCGFWGGWWQGGCWGVFPFSFSHVFAVFLSGGSCFFWPLPSKTAGVCSSSIPQGASAETVVYHLIEAPVFVNRFHIIIMVMIMIMLWAHMHWSSWYGLKKHSKKHIVFLIIEIMLFQNSCLGCLCGGVLPRMLTTFSFHTEVHLYY